MIKRLFLFSFLLVHFAFVPPKSVKWEDINSILNSTSDTTVVINFWATWCRPCIAEMPDFKKLESTYSETNVKVILISLDFSDVVDSKVVPLLKKKKIEFPTLHFDDPDFNSWIPKVNEKWSGAIPATIVLNNARKFNYFHEGQIHFYELDSIIQNNKLTK